MKISLNRYLVLKIMCGFIHSKFGVFCYTKTYKVFGFCLSTFLWSKCAVFGCNQLNYTGHWFIPPERTGNPHPSITVTINNYIIIITSLYLNVIDGGYKPLNNNIYHDINNMVWSQRSRFYSSLLNISHYTYTHWSLALNRVYPLS